MFFGRKLFIYVGYGIMKKKSEKLFESAIYSKKKNSIRFSFSIYWLNIDVCLFKTQYIKNYYLEALTKNISQVNNVQSFKNMQFD